MDSAAGGLVVDHNAAPVIPGSVSCVFMPIWFAPGHRTVGCTALAQPQLESILA